MYNFEINTLVDITENGDLKKQFPFKTKSNELIHDPRSLAIAKNQNSNFTTLLQLLQMRGNIRWEASPIKKELNLKDTQFGTKYEGKAAVWSYAWETEQQDIYNNFESDDLFGALINDFDHIPVVNFCKETVTFPSSAFITTDNQFKNTYFKYLGVLNK